MALFACKVGGAEGAVDPIVFGMHGINGQQTRLYIYPDIFNNYKYFKTSKKPAFFWVDGTSHSMTVPQANTWYACADYPATTKWVIQESSDMDITFSNSNA